MEIILKNLTKELNGNRVVNNVNLSLYAGKIYGLCGYNGCGKTMLMRLIAGMVRPTMGTVTIDGKQLGKDMDFPPKMGVLIENPAFLGNYSGYENLRLLASISGKINSDMIEDVLERVGLSDSAKKKYRKYSLGMKQRLGIAAAIMEKPNLLILDEPTNALDTDGVQRTKEIIREERNRGTLVIMTCHDRAILEDLCDEIFNIEHGTVMIASTKDEGGR